MEEKHFIHIPKEITVPEGNSFSHFIALFSFNFTTQLSRAQNYFCKIIRIFSKNSYIDKVIYIYKNDTSNNLKPYVIHEYLEDHKLSSFFHVSEEK